MRRKNKNFDTMEMEEFFGGTDLESPVEEYTPQRSVLKDLGKFLLASITCGLLGLIPMLELRITGVQAAAPATNIWKHIPDSIPNVSIAQRNVIYDKNGSIIAQTWTEDRIQIQKVSQIGSNAINSLISTEDRNFYKNAGFDPKGTLRAAVSGSGGGSGITQQLIKNLQFYNLLGKNTKGQAVERSYLRKIKELKMSMQYEKTHSKDQILVDYFNTVAFGAPNVYGIETASQYFFNKHANQLTVPEAAALIGSAQNPVIYNMKSTDQTAWKKRQKEVLDNLVVTKKITQQQENTFVNQQLDFHIKKSSGGGCSQSKYPFYCQYVMTYLANDPRLGDTPAEREAILAKGGLQIKTYMDPNAMNSINNYMKTNWGYTNRIVAPTALVQPGTGGLVAMGANREYGSGSGKTTIDLPATPSGEGSVYKMFTLAAALNSGWTEDSLQFSSQCPLYPGPNYDSPSGGYRNSVSCSFQGGYKNYKEATALSSNTWFVTLEMKIGVNRVKEFSKSVGLAAPDWIDSRSLSYTLGSVSNSPIRLAAAFATFSNGGIYCPPTPVASMNYADGSSIGIPDHYDPASTSCRRVMSAKNAGIVAKAMRADVSGEVKNAFGIPANIKGIDNGGKSGTNQLLNSSWAQITGYYTIFTNVYDMTQTSRGIDGAIFKGVATSWHKNTAQTSGSEMLRSLVSGKKNIPINWNSSDTSLSKVPIDESTFFTTPTVLGMSPADAVATLQNAGIQAVVSKKPASNVPAGFNSGVIAQQSISGGTKLPIGTKQVVVLSIAQ